MGNFRKTVFNKIKSIKLVQLIIAGAIWLAIKLVFLMNGKEVRGLNTLKDFLNRPAIFVFWHGRSLMMSAFARRFGFRGYVTSSMHNDGLLMARVQRMFGMKSIFGSSAKGGLNVLRQGIRVLENGSGIVLTVDGPKGPRMRLSDGCLYLAKVTGAPVIPVCLTATRTRILKTWDRFMIVMPFGRVIGQFGDPIYFDRSNPDEMKDMHEKLEAYMVRQLRELDAEIGLPPIEQEELQK